LAIEKPFERLLPEIKNRFRSFSEERSEGFLSGINRTDSSKRVIPFVSIPEYIASLDPLARRMVCWGIEPRPLGRDS
jgi:hypothetical protein